MVPHLARTNAGDLDDVQLMALVQGADMSAFTVLVNRHHGRCYALAWRILQDRREVEDAVQEVFVKLWRGRRDLTPRAGASPAG